MSMTSPLVSSLVLGLAPGQPPQQTGVISIWRLDEVTLPYLFPMLRQHANSSKVSILYLGESQNAYHCLESPNALAFLPLHLYLVSSSPGFPFVPKCAKYFSYAKASHMMLSLPAMFFPIPHMVTFSYSSIFFINLKSPLTFLYNIFWSSTHYIYLICIPHKTYVAHN